MNERFYKSAASAVIGLYESGQPLTKESVYETLKRVGELNFEDTIERRTEVLLLMLKLDRAFYSSSYDYLKDAVMIAASLDKTPNMRRDIYSPIMKKYNVGYKGVDNLICLMKKRILTENDRERLDEVLNEPPFLDNDSVTNKEFIIWLGQVVRENCNA